MEKPLNLILEDEIAKLKQSLIESVNSAALPASVKKIVIESSARDICAALQNMTDKERVELAKKIEAKKADGKGEKKDGKPDNR
jgi:hypothetical protein